MFPTSARSPVAFARCMAFNLHNSPTPVGFLLGHLLVLSCCAMQGVGACDSCGQKRARTALRATYSSSEPCFSTLGQTNEKVEIEGRLHNLCLYFPVATAIKSSWRA